MPGTFDRAYQLSLTFGAVACRTAGNNLALLGKKFSQDVAIPL